MLYVNSGMQGGGKCFHVFWFTTHGKTWTCYTYSHEGLPLIRKYNMFQVRKGCSKADSHTSVTYQCRVRSVLQCQWKKISLLWIQPKNSHTSGARAQYSVLTLSDRTVSVPWSLVSSPPIFFRSSRTPEESSELSGKWMTNYLLNWCETNLFFMICHNQNIWIEISSKIYAIQEHS